MALQEKVFSFLASSSQESESALAILTKRYGQNVPEKADVIIALGGDGFLLKIVHETMHLQKPVYGMNCGGIGFLMNEFHADDLHARIAKSTQGCIQPLEMKAFTSDGQETKALAINEVALWRQSCQSAKIRISIDGRTTLEELSGDGIMVATPAGSTAYNLSAHGPILPLEAPLLALTPVSPFRPRRWKGALISNSATIRFDILESHKRPVNAAADYIEIRSVEKVIIRKTENIQFKLLFDPDHSWNERILREQFLC